MKQIAITLAIVCLLGQQALAQRTEGATSAPQSPARTLTVELAVAAQPLGQGPMLLARLTVHGASPSLAAQVAAVSVRDSDGGPTVLAPLALPPGQDAVLTLPLAAWSVEHSYVVRLLPALDASAVPLFQSTLEVQWPPAAVGEARLIAPSLYNRFEYDLPRWSSHTRSGALIVAAVAVLVSTSLLLVRRRWFRAAGGCVALAGLAFAAVMLLRDESLVEQRRLVTPAGRSIEAMTVDVVASKRTTAWTSKEPLQPVYASVAQAAGDDAVIIVGQRVSATLTPRQVRIFRAWPGPVTATE